MIGTEVQWRAIHKSNSIFYHLFTRLREILVVEDQMTVSNYCKESVGKFPVCIVTEHCTLLSEVAF